MKVIRTSIFLVIAALSLAGCLRTIVVQQGNIITPDMLAKVKPGMTKSQVYQTLGEPILVNTFDSKKDSYVYSFTCRFHTKPKVQRLTLGFNANNKLQTIDGQAIGASFDPITACE